MNKTNVIRIIGITCLFILLSSSVRIQAIFDHDNRKPEGERSLPLLIRQNNDIIYILSKRDLSNLQFEIKDMSGNVVQEEYITLPSQLLYPIYIDNLPAWNQYTLIIYQEDKQLITYTIYK